MIHEASRSSAALTQRLPRFGHGKWRPGEFRDTLPSSELEAKSSLPRGSEGVQVLETTINPSLHSSTGRWRRNLLGSSSSRLC
jgi:hypothetical protein